MVYLYRILYTSSENTNGYAWFARIPPPEVRCVAVLQLDGRRRKWSAGVNDGRRRVNDNATKNIFLTYVIETTKHTNDMEPSSYILRALKVENKDMFIQKCLKFLNIDLHKNPSHKWTSGRSYRDEVPRLDYTNVYSYLISFRQCNKKLQTYKSLNRGYLSRVVMSRANHV